jgi:glycerol kinase
VESIAFRVKEVVDAVEREGVAIPFLKVDGGLTRSGPLMQLHADVLQRPVHVFEEAEATAYGAALFAGLSCSLWEPNDIPGEEESPRCFTPDKRRSEREAVRFEKWKELVVSSVNEAGRWD